MRKEHASGEKRHSTLSGGRRVGHGDRQRQPNSGAAARHTTARGRYTRDVPDGTIPAAFISPYQASQPQSGQHSATVVRTSVSGPSQQQVLFYSSVQRRGGVFTKTAQETTAQLARTGVLPNSTAARKRARAALEEAEGKPQTLRGRFVEMQSARAQEELQQAKTRVAKKDGGNRFAVDTDDDSDEA